MCSLRGWLVLSLAVIPSFAFAYGPKCVAPPPANSLSLSPSPSPSLSPSPSPSPYLGSTLPARFQFRKFAYGSKVTTDSKDFGGGVVRTQTENYSQTSLWNTRVLIDMNQSGSPIVSDHWDMINYGIPPRHVEQCSRKLIIDGQTIVNWTVTQPGCSQTFVLESPIEISVPGQLLYRTRTAVQSNVFVDTSGTYGGGIIVNSCEAQINYGCLRAVSRIPNPTTSQYQTVYDRLGLGIAYLVNADRAASAMGVTGYDFTVQNLCQ
jgi:hypothetical protein